MGPDRASGVAGYGSEVGLWTTRRGALDSRSGRLAIGGCRQPRARARLRWCEGASRGRRVTRIRACSMMRSRASTASTDTPSTSASMLARIPGSSRRTRSMRSSSVACRRRALTCGGAAPSSAANAALMTRALALEFGESLLATRRRGAARSTCRSARSRVRLFTPRRRHRGCRHGSSERDSR